MGLATEAVNCRFTRSLWVATFTRLRLRYFGLGGPDRPLFTHDPKDQLGVHDRSTLERQDGADLPHPIGAPRRHVESNGFGHEHPMDISIQGVEGLERFIPPTRQAVPSAKYRSLCPLMTWPSLLVHQVGDHAPSSSASARSDPA